MKFSSVPSYSMPGRSNYEPLTTDKLSPGPCAYDTVAESSNQPSYTFAKSLRANLFNPIPSPGPSDYTIPEEKPVLHKKPSLSPSLKDRNKQPLPGPGFYNPNPQFSTQKFTMSSKMPETPASLNPVGPGSYSPNSKLYNSRSAVFPKGSRFPQKKESSPGPGAYSSKPEGVVTSKFSQASRIIHKNILSPGPGAYDIVSAKGVGKTLNGRNFIKERMSESPGPGAYDTIPASNSPVYTMGRDDKLKPAKQEIGPGLINLGTTLTSPGKTFGRAERTEHKKTPSPGPGSFNFNNFIGEGPKYSIPERKLKYVTSDVPGPAYYSPKVDKKVYSSTFAKEARFRLSKMETPGPGHYEAKKYKTANVVFGKEPREKEESDDEPGPGYYNLPPSIPDVPKYCLAKDRPIEMTNFY